jgi:dihydrofolate reductase
VKERETMRKIVAALFMSLDGVVESPEHWGFQYFSEELTAAVSDEIAQADAVLLGRRTYLEFAEIWPSQGSEVPMSEFLNESHKYVVSTRLDNFEWEPATLISGNLRDELIKLKEQPGKNIQIPGSPTLVCSLLRDRFLDELTLSICPIVVGAGLRLFEGISNHVPLDVLHSAPFRNGVVNVTYAPASADRLPDQPPVAAFPEPAT